ncbi:hypothetical protein HY969_04795 [Candidatus Kaiserbacteria bacterium]|nr:hypothetical protein [Candidatus Kaiserbacteria bacterium]
MRELTGEEQEVPKFAANDDGFAEGAVFVRRPQEGPRILGNMQNEAGIEPHSDANDNMPLLVGDWVVAKGESYAEYLRVALKTKGPYVIARRVGDEMYLVARRDYKVGMILPIERQFGMGEEEELMSESPKPKFARMELKDIKLYHTLKTVK